MKAKEMRVFHGLVNYGTQAGILAKGLREVGIEAYSVSYYDSYSRIIDKSLIYSDNWIIRRFQSVYFFFTKLKYFFHYNIFHFYFGRGLFWGNVDLPFYKLFGKKVVMEYLGTDVDLWLGLNGLDWRGRPINRVNLVKKVYKQSIQTNKQLVCAPYYKQFVDNSIVLPLALDLNEYKLYPINKKDELTIMHCPSSRTAKKTDYLEAALERLRQEGYKFQYNCVTNVSHKQLKEEYIKADIVVDQLNFWYGTVAVEAMALGRPVVAGYYPHICHLDSRYENLPIINADIFNIYNVMKDILDGKYNLEDIGIRSRNFVMKTHDLQAVIHQLVDVYEKL